MSDTQKYYWTCGSGLVGILMTLEQAQSVHHSGRCDEESQALQHHPDIAAQTAGWSVEDTAETVRDMFADITETELMEHDSNVMRILFMAGNDIAEDPDQYSDDGDPGFEVPVEPDGNAPIEVVVYNCGGVSYVGKCPANVDLKIVDYDVTEEYQKRTGNEVIITACPAGEVTRMAVHLREDIDAYQDPYKD